MRGDCLEVSDRCNYNDLELLAGGGPCVCVDQVCTVTSNLSPVFSSLSILCPKILHHRLNNRKGDTRVFLWGLFEPGRKKQFLKYL